MSQEAQDMQAAMCESRASGGALGQPGRRKTRGSHFRLQQFSRYRGLGSRGFGFRLFFLGVWVSTVAGDLGVSERGGHVGGVVSLEHGKEETSDLAKAIQTPSPKP